MLYSADMKLLLILFPIIVIQYAAAIFCLLKLINLSPSRKQFLFWNIFILLAVCIGFITFLICFYCFKDKVFKKALSEKSTEVNAVSASEIDSPTEISQPNDKTQT